MSAKMGRLEVKHTFTANQTVTLDDAATASYQIILPAGSYYPSEIVSYLADNVAGGGNWSITCDWGEGASTTGKVTITTTNTPFSITWTSTQIRDALGFTANASSVSVAQTGAYHARGVWLPRTVKYSLHGDDDAGVPVTSIRQTVGPTGTVHALSGPQHARIDGVRWEGVGQAYGRLHHGSTTYATFEDFYLDATTARLSTIPVNPGAMIVWDADDLYDQATSGATQGRFIWPTSIADICRVAQDGWVGRYRIEMPPLIVEGS